ncbi:MAG: putative lipid II flippase FtsW [Nitrospiraceae bacterium]|nr:MAG: putative lipid II flippase FtsW [Nitrospiraceae bacterium]
MSQKTAGTLALPWPSSGRKTRKRVPVDRTLLVITAVLALLGLVMVFSASAVVAGNRFQDPGYFLKRQVAWLAFGFALLHVASRVDYAVWRKLALPILGFSAVLLILVLIPSVGVAAKGARRWLRLGPISVQPAEIVKLVSVIYLAAYLAKKEDKIRLFAKGFLPPLIVVGVLSGLVLLQPDLGTVVVMGLATAGMLFLGGARLTHLIGLALCALPVGLALVLGSSYRRQRLLTFLSPWKDASDAGFQVTQSFLAFGSGGPFGVGLGEGKQKLFFLPEAHTDFVLALVGEELGLVGTSAIMLLFAIFLLKGFQIAGRARMPFGRHLGTGITLLVGIQALINAGVATGLLPTKGLTLPFVSYGGSSLVVNLVGVGLLLSISRDRQGGRQVGGHRSGYGNGSVDR